ncbi:alanine racemase [Flavobacterium antarcticum]|uniref:alanine racemase n=1 Tax=Flavobacterium antarcticum TaxID=271155 RepID=UPI0003B5E6D5|nr:alanine racemase [Flavobacterium antarcticum]
MHTNSHIEINQNALQNNIDFLKKLYGKKVILSSVVKGNAYGHGIPEFVRSAFSCGVTHFSVFDADEARAVKKELQDKVSILIMGFVSDEDIFWAIENNVSFYVFDKIRMQKTIKIAKKLNKKATIHIEVETGMNRTGFEKSELLWVSKMLKENTDTLIFEGLCTHFAGAESVSNFYRIEKQISNFTTAETFFRKENLVPNIKHSACSAASIMFPETRMDLVRIGIMQYGLWSSPEVFVHYLNSKKIKKDPLQRIISWKSEVMSVKKVNPGDYIGYGTSFMASEKMKVAVIPVGYSHGYSRSLSNHGRVLINGKRCMVIGTVNMNMLTVNVSDLETVKKGDEAVLIGNQEDISISIASFSDFSNTLNYELLTRLDKGIPRKII